MMRDSEPNFSIGRQSSEVDRQAQLLLELQRRLGMQGPYVGAQARISAHLCSEPTDIQVVGLFCLPCRFALPAGQPLQPDMYWCRCELCGDLSRTLRFVRA